MGRGREKGEREGRGRTRIREREGQEAVKEEDEREKRGDRGDKIENVCEAGRIEEKGWGGRGGRVKVHKREDMWKEEKVEGGREEGGGNETEEG